MSSPHKKKTRKEMDRRYTAYAKRRELKERQRRAQSKKPEQPEQPDNQPSLKARDIGDGVKIRTSMDRWW